MGKVVKTAVLDTEIVSSMCINRRVFSDQAQAPWGGTRGCDRWERG